MKIKILLTVVSAFIILHSAFGQGALTPPGAPAPTMKSLAQIEPRTDVLKLGGDANNLFLITNAGSYYLTTNLMGVSGKNGIKINSGHVTLDLNGFAVLGVPGSGSGIYVIQCTNVTVLNGTVSGWGGTGVDAFTTGNERNLVFEHLTVSANGGYGIKTAGPNVVHDCRVLGSSLVGIYDTGGLISSCSVLSSGAVGIAANSSTVSRCLVQGSAQSGIYVNAPGSQIIGNTCYGNNTSGGAADAGIYINDSSNRVEDNHVTGSGHAGIVVNNFNYNVIIKNTVSGNTNVLANNYIVTGNNALGPLISTFGIITNSNPWANFAF